MKFVILAMSRVGSYMLGSALNAHPDTICFGELLKKNDLRPIDYLDLHKYTDRVEGRIAHRLRDPVAFVEHALSVAESHAYAVGFKLMLGQNAVALDHFLSERDIPIILLYRENLLASYASQQVARATDQGVALKGEVVRRTQIEFVISDFERFRRRRERLYATTRQILARSPSRKLCEVEYMEAVNGSGIRRVLELLGLEASSLPEPETQQRSRGQLIERFSNPEDVHAYLETLRCTHWLSSERSLSD